MNAEPQSSCEEVLSRRAEGCAPAARCRRSSAAASRPVKTHPPRNVPSSERLPCTPPPPKPAASPTAYRPGIGSPVAVPCTPAGAPSSDRNEWTAVDASPSAQHAAAEVGLDAAQALARHRLQADRDQRHRLGVDDALEARGAQAVAAPVAQLADAPQLVVVEQPLAARDRVVVAAHSRSSTAVSIAPRQLGGDVVHLARQLAERGGRARSRASPRGNGVRARACRAAR